MTGGDFGLIITRPQVSFHLSPWSSFSGELHIQEEYQCGLLCQAKLKNRKCQWGSLSKRQKEIFPERMNYLAFLLYEYTDKARCHLREFQWQLCQNATSVQNVIGWLKSDQFPALVDSAEIIRRLGNAEIGTDEKEIGEKIIQPTGRPHIHIRIFWPPDKRPPVPVSVHVSSLLIQQEPKGESQQIDIHHG